MSETEGTTNTQPASAPPQGQTTPPASQPDKQASAPAQAQVDVAAIEKSITEKLTSTLGAQHKKEIAQLTARQQAAAQQLLGQNPDAKKTSFVLEGLKNDPDNFMIAYGNELEKQITAKLTEQTKKQAAIQQAVGKTYREYTSKYDLNEKQLQAVATMSAGLEQSGIESGEAVETAFKTFVESAGVQERAPADGVVSSFGQNTVAGGASIKQAHAKALEAENAIKRSSRNWRNRHKAT